MREPRGRAASERARHSLSGLSHADVGNSQLVVCPLVTDARRGLSLALRVRLTLLLARSLIDDLVLRAALSDSVWHGFPLPDRAADNPRGGRVRVPIARR